MNELVCRYCGYFEGEHENPEEKRKVIESISGYDTSLSDCPGYEPIPPDELRRIERKHYRATSASD